MPYDDEVAPTYPNLISATRDTNGGLTSDLTASGSYRAGGFSLEAIGGEDAELDYVCNTLSTISNREAHCGLTNVTDMTFGYLPSLFSWRWQVVSGALSATPYDRMGGGLIVAAAQTGFSLPIACRIIISPAGVVTWRFGNGSDVLVHTSVLSPSPVLEMLPGLFVVAGFNNQNSAFTPITFKSNGMVNRASRDAGGPPAVGQRVVPEFSPDGGAAPPPPLYGQRWPRR